MSKIEVKNSKLFSKGFNASFVKLCQIKNLDANSKISLVRLRKDFTEQINTIKEASLPMEQFKDAMEQETSYIFETIPQSKVIDHLSADDLFFLEPLLSQGGN